MGGGSKGRVRGRVGTREHEGGEGGRGGRGGRVRGREGREGGRDDCYTYSNRYVQ